MKPADHEIETESENWEFAMKVTEKFELMDYSCIFSPFNENTYDIVKYRNINLFCLYETIMSLVLIHQNYSLL